LEPKDSLTSEWLPTLYFYQDPFAGDMISRLSFPDKKIIYRGKHGKCQKQCQYPNEPKTASQPRGFHFAINLVHPLLEIIRPQPLQSISMDNHALFNGNFRIRCFKDYRALTRNRAITTAEKNKETKRIRYLQPDFPKKETYLSLLRFFQ
jgi:hypothetical protein